MANLRTVRGMRDFLPDDAYNMSYLQNAAKEIAQVYGFNKVITPVVEHQDLFSLKSSEEIREHMYVFKDYSGRKLALRPEFTASIARLVVTRMMSSPKPLRLFCEGSLYRYDRPQLGRFREFWQANYELIGSRNSEADAEILMLVDDFIERIGIDNHIFRVGHIGIVRSILFQEQIEDTQQNRIIQLIDKGQKDDALSTMKRLGVSKSGTDVLQELFEHKGNNLPKILRETKKILYQYKKAVESVKNLMEILKLAKTAKNSLELSVEPGFARGLEYYTGIIFEVYIPEMNIAVGGGGRYDKLIELFGGESTPAVGVALGMDRLLLALGKQVISLNVKNEIRVRIIPTGVEMKERAFRLSSFLRKEGIYTDVEIMGRPVSKSLSDADRRGIDYAIIVGPEEEKDEKVIVRDMKKRTQRKIEVNYLKDEIKKRIDLIFQP